MNMSKQSCLRGQCQISPGEEPVCSVCGWGYRLTELLSRITMNEARSEVQWFDGDKSIRDEGEDSVPTASSKISWTLAT